MPGVIAALSDRIDFTESGCWEWTGPTNNHGYGRTGNAEYVHRVVWRETVGPIPEGLELDHLCRNPACCNPDHLEPVTHAENMRRSLSANRAKTHCPAGHPYDERNTLLAEKPQGWKNRICKACKADRQRRYRARLRLERGQ